MNLIEANELRLHKLVILGIISLHGKLCATPVFEAKDSLNRIPPEPPMRARVVLEVRDALFGVENPSMVKPSSRACRVATESLLPIAVIKEIAGRECQRSESAQTPSIWVTPIRANTQISPTNLRAPDLKTQLREQRGLRQRGGFQLYNYRCERTALTAILASQIVPKFSIPNQSKVQHEESTQRDDIKVRTRINRLLLKNEQCYFL